MGNQDLIGAREAADILGVSRDTLLRWASEPKISAVKLPGETGAYVFARADVEKLRDELELAKATA